MSSCFCLLHLDFKTVIHLFSYFPMLFKLLILNGKGRSVESSILPNNKRGSYPWKPSDLTTEILLYTSFPSPTLHCYIWRKPDSTLPSLPVSSHLYLSEAHQAAEESFLSEKLVSAEEVSFSFVAFLHNKM